MPSTGSAAMLLTFDVAAGAVAEHDDWHTHEHIPERIGIPGFLRGSRWISRSGSPRYFVMYEVRDLAVLTSAPYLERLNNPTPWTEKIMPSYIGMRRALCEVAASFGSGVGGTALFIRFAPEKGRDIGLRDWLVHEALPGLVNRPGIASARLFAASVPAPMTREQRVRGKDASLNSAVLVTGYDTDAVAALATKDLLHEHFVAHGAAPVDHACGIYFCTFSLASADVADA